MGYEYQIKIDVSIEKINIKGYSLALFKCF